MMTLLSPAAAPGGLMKAAALLFVAVLALGLARTAHAEPRVWAEVQAQDCFQPRYLRATGVDPEAEVVFELSWGGSSPGSLAATSDADGNWTSPIPHALMPCAEGGLVTARLVKGGPPMSTEFEVLLATSTPTPVTATSTPISPSTGVGVIEDSAGAGTTLLVFGGALLASSLMLVTVARGPRGRAGE
jgi:hypothetical protein